MKLDINILKCLGIQAPGRSWWSWSNRASSNLANLQHLSSAFDLLVDYGTFDDISDAGNC